MATWREEIEDAMAEAGDSFDNLISCTLSSSELDKEFNSGYGAIKGEPFTLWTNNFVYFPLCYDGSEWCGYAPRNPSDKAMEHQGGG